MFFNQIWISFLITNYGRHDGRFPDLAHPYQKNQQTTERTQETSMAIGIFFIKIRISFLITNYDRHRRLRLVNSCPFPDLAHP